MFSRTFLLCALLTAAAAVAEAVTIRSKGDLRLWQTVFDRTAPLVWNWEAGAEAATVTFRRVKATGSEGEAVTVPQTVVTVARTADARCGCCVLPSPPMASAGEALFDVTLVQTSGAVEVSRETARLALVSGAGTGTGAGPITVEAKTRSAWRRVTAPRVSGYDAAWWQTTGGSGYDVFWSDASGVRTVSRAFPAAGVVQETALRFVLPGFLFSVR